MTDTVVHTLEARDNFLLSFMQERFSLDGADMRRLIVRSVEQTRDALRLRGIDYDALGPALTPRARRHEVALFFDVARIGESWYGRTVHTALLPLIIPDGSHSVLHGDLVGSPSLVSALLSIHMRPAGRILIPSSGTEFYCVYITNCSDGMIEALHDGLTGRIGFLGCADVTYGSDFKTYLSGTLGAGYVQVRQFVIQPHEDDSAENTNQDTLGYGFGNAGFTCRSISSSLFGLFLSYKIERPVLNGDERDRLLALNAISANPDDISNCAIEISDAKFAYLNEKKTESMRRIGVLGAASATLADLIRAKLRSNYLYRMRFQSDYQVASFNILLELEDADSDEPFRAVAGFEYDAPRNVIRLLTMF